MNAVLTICSINYLAKAVSLAMSVLRTSPNTDVVMLIVDRKIESVEVQLLQLLQERTRILWVEDLPIDNLPSHAFAFDVIEFNTNVKPDAILFAFQKLKYSKVMYLDPDVYVYSDLQVVFDELEQASMVLTPHYIQPVIEDSPNDIDLLKFGPYNLGFVAVKRTDGTERFLRWWGDRCLQWGYYDPTVGLAVDQKWMSLAHCFLDNVLVLKHLGCNLAFWNLHERRLAQTNNVWMINNSYPLVFVHYSSFDPAVEGHIANKQSRFKPGDRPDFAAVAKEYRESLSSILQKFPEHHMYSFDFFYDQKYLPPMLRRVYGALRGLQFPMNQDPFEPNGEVRSFSESQGLLSRGNNQQKRVGTKSVAGFSSFFPVLKMGLRLLMRMVGPQRYFLMTKAFGFLSSPHQHAYLMYGEKKVSDAKTEEGMP